MHVEPFGSKWTPEQIATACVGQGLAWLDSNHSGKRDGRYSFIGAYPRERVSAPMGVAQPWQALERLHFSAPEGAVGELPLSRVPWWIGYVAYDSALPEQRSASTDSALQFARYDAVAVFDHHQGAGYWVGATEDDVRRLEQGVLDVVPTTPTSSHDSPQIGRMHVGAAAAHAGAIERALEHIACGDLYQVNLARRWRAKFTGSPFPLYQEMRAASPVPLGMYLEAGGETLLSRSMELFLGFDAQRQKLVTRPIKGTITATDDSAQDASALKRDPKEQAEHSMIVDLMRNDLGRVAEFGSVKLEKIMEVERYARLSHLVSTIGCSTRDDAGLGEILDATFPPGSITGTPKIRAIEIIEDLEPTERGIYCGALGAIDRSGGLQLSVGIRTAVVSDGEIRYQAGGGIVTASRVEREIAETELKARVFLDAVDRIRDVAHQPPSVLSGFP